MAQFVAVPTRPSRWHIAFLLKVVVEAQYIVYSFYINLSRHRLLVALGVLGNDLYIYCACGEVLYGPLVWCGGLRVNEDVVGIEAHGLYLALVGRRLGCHVELCLTFSGIEEEGALVGGGGDELYRRSTHVDGILFTELPYLVAGEHALVV